MGPYFHFMANIDYMNTNFAYPEPVAKNKAFYRLKSRPLYTLKAGAISGAIWSKYSNIYPFLSRA